MTETMPLAPAELGAARALQIHDAHGALRDMLELSVRFLARINESAVVVSRFSAGVHWAGHPAADDLLYSIKSDAEITTLTANGPIESALPQGSLVVCPRGRWHRQRAARGVTLLSGTPGPSEVSWAADSPF